MAYPHPGKPEPSRCITILALPIILVAGVIQLIDWLLQQWFTYFIFIGIMLAILVAYLARII